MKNKTESILDLLFNEVELVIEKKEPHDADDLKRLQNAAMFSLGALMLLQNTFGESVINQAFDHVMTVANSIKDGAVE